MSLTQRDVENIAWLARLEITEEEMAGLVEDLGGILEFVEQLGAAPVDDVQPMAHPLDMNQRLRQDRVTETDQRELFQAAAPEAQDGLYLVPRVIE